MHARTHKALIHLLALTSLSHHFNSSFAHFHFQLYLCLPFSLSSSALLFLVKYLTKWSALPYFPRAPPTITQRIHINCKFPRKNISWVNFWNIANVVKIFVLNNFVSVALLFYAWLLLLSKRKNLVQFGLTFQRTTNGRARMEREKNVEFLHLISFEMCGNVREWERDRKSEGKERNFLNFISLVKKLQLQQLKLQQQQ